MNEIVRAPPMPTAGSALIPRDMNSAMQLANMMAGSKLVPTHLQRSPGDCLLVIEQAMRWGMSPFAVAQCTSVIQGKLMFDGKLVSAALHNSGIMASRLEYEFTGAGDMRTITARGTLRGETKPRDIDVTLKDAKTSNGMWQKQPDQQLVYFATRAWARRHAPEVMLGVYSPEEFDAATPRSDAFAGATIEADHPTTVTLGIDPPSDHTAAPKRTVADAINELATEFEAAATKDEVDAVLASEKCQRTMDYARNGARERLDGIISTALARTALPVDDAHSDDDPLPGIDTEMDRSAEFTTEIGACQTAAEIRAFARNPAVQRKMREWKADRPALFQAVDDFIAERLLAFEPPTVER